MGPVSKAEGHESLSRVFLPSPARVMSERCRLLPAPSVWNLQGNMGNIMQQSFYPLEGLLTGRRLNDMLKRSSKTEAG